MVVICDGGIEIVCPKCGKRHDFKAVNYQIIWANKAGRKVRIFCSDCNIIHDVTKTYTKEYSETRKWRR